MTEPPDVYRYLDYRQYLADWFEARKAANPRFSHRVFARLAHQRSPSLLKHVIDGKRNLTSETTAAFVAAMKLAPGPAEFFGHLVDLDQAKTAGERAEALEAILAVKRFAEARALEGEAFKVVSTWYHSAIRELAYRDDFRDDPAWIARTLRPRITPGQARKAVDTLIELGLLSRCDGDLRPADAELVTPHEVADVAANHYHQGMLDLAREAVTEFGQSERHLLGLTVAIPTRLVPVLKQRLNRLQEDLLHLCDQSPREVVYQVELALFPLSDAARSAR